jgi:hypothetical protein
MLRKALLALVIAFGTAQGAYADEIERSDGTLPLRLPSDGTLPLRLGGEAIQGLNRVATQITISSAVTQALSGVAASSFTCQIAGENVSKHAASGSVLVGLVQYNIKGICFDADTHKMEVVAQRAGSADRSFLAGTLANPEPRAFSGRLTVTGDGAGSYSFSTQCIDEIHRQ